MASHELSMESIDSGSNYSFGDKMIIPKNPKSMFDLTFLSTMDIYNAGPVIPIASPIECIPGDDLEISVASLIRVMPQEVPLYSRQRLYVYAFYSRCSDLWENWNVFATKGKLGTTIKEIPTLKSRNFKNGQYNDDGGTIKPNSLADYMGLPIGLDVTGDTWSGKISALPFMMYARIWRDYFINKNTVAGNPIIFPDNDDHFRLDDNGRLISAKDQDYEDELHVKHEFDLIFNSSGTAEEGQTESEQWLLNNKAKYGVSCAVDDEKMNIRMGIFYHNWPDDRFTDALPWPQRGDTPTIDNKISDLFKDDGAHKLLMKDIPGMYLWAATQDSDESPYAGSRRYLYDIGMSGSTPNPNWLSYGESGKNIADYDTFDHYHQTQLTQNGHEQRLFFAENEIGNYLNKLIKENVKTSITLNQIRELAIAQTELEKMARTDGTYLGFGLTFFNEKPKNAIDYKPVYIGGCYTDLDFTEVLQTGAATESSPLGNYAGHGIGGNPGNQGYIGKVHCDDYGYVMLLGCIMPDVYYSQKVDKMWTRKFQSDIYLPERAKMGMIPMLYHELYALGAPSGKTVFDLFAWNNPFDELRYKANEIHGQIADSSNEYFKNYTQSRMFGSCPEWGKEFSEAKDVRMDYLATGNTESAYTAQFKINIRAVRELPYKPVPAQII